jgi:hypothetical protein
VDGGEQGVAGGDQGRRITPAAEEPGRQSRGGKKQRRQEEERGGELNQGLICEIRERQGPYCKGLATFKPVLK